MPAKKMSRFLKLDEVAERLGVSVRTVYRIMSQQELPRPLKVRGCSVLDESVVIEYQQKILGKGG